MKKVLYPRGLVLSVLVAASEMGFHCLHLYPKNV